MKKRYSRITPLLVLSLLGLGLASCGTSGDTSVTQDTIDSVESVDSVDTVESVDISDTTIVELDPEEVLLAKIGDRLNDIECNFTLTQGDLVIQNTENYVVSPYGSQVLLSDDCWHVVEMDDEGNLTVSFKTIEDVVPPNLSALQDLGFFVYDEERDLLVSEDSELITVIALALCWEPTWIDLFDQAIVGVDEDEELLIGICMSGAGVDGEDIEDIAVLSDIGTTAVPYLDDFIASGEIPGLPNPEIKADIDGLLDLHNYTAQYTITIAGYDYDLASNTVGASLDGYPKSSTFEEILTDTVYSTSNQKQVFQKVDDGILKYTLNNEGTYDTALQEAEGELVDIFYTPVDFQSVEYYDVDEEGVISFGEDDVVGLDLLPEMFGYDIMFGSASSTTQSVIDYDLDAKTLDIAVDYADLFYKDQTNTDIILLALTIEVNMTNIGTSTFDIGALPLSTPEA